MDSDKTEGGRKRTRLAMEEKEGDVGDGALVETAEEEETERSVAGSEEMVLNMSRIHEKIEHFTQMVSELLESGKNLFKEMSNVFEEQLITMHKQHMEKWQEEIKELQMLDAANEEVNALLHNARFLLQNVQTES